MVHLVADDQARTGKVRREEPFLWPNDTTEIFYPVDIDGLDKGEYI